MSETLPYIKGLLDAARMVEDAELQGLGLASAARSIRRHANGCAEVVAAARCTDDALTCPACHPQG